jgi:hypothetical protein
MEVSTNLILKLQTNVEVQTIHQIQRRAHLLSQNRSEITITGGGKATEGAAVGGGRVAIFFTYPVRTEDW